MGNLLYYAIIFLVVAVVAALLGFGGVAGTALSGAHLLISIAVLFFVVAIIASLFRRA